MKRKEINNILAAYNKLAESELEPIDLFSHEFGVKMTPEQYDTLRPFLEATRTCNFSINDCQFQTTGKIFNAVFTINDSLYLAMPSTAIFMTTLCELHELIRIVFGMYKKVKLSELYK